LVVRPAGAHATVDELARHAGVPVVNGLSDKDHPCQVLTDLFTLFERREHPYKSRLAFVGDSVPMANGYLALAALTGLEVRLALPEGVAVDAEVLKRAQARAKVIVTTSPTDAVTGADAVATAAWSGPVADGFRLDDALLARASDDVVVLHPLPARRGQEITDDVLEGPRSVAFQQAQNRLPVQQAILEALLS
jgi:ornithine carbamoyltransferase